MPSTTSDEEALAIGRETMRAIHLIVLMLFILPAPGCTAAEDNEPAEDNRPADCVTLLRDRCEGCHYNTRVCQQLDKKSKRAWPRSLKRMIAYGVKLTPAEQETILKCLQEPSATVRDYCNNP
jgi:hypothetical protein